MTQELVLVTGVTGYLGSHVVNELLKAGYRVRGTARSAKVDAAKQGYIQYGDRYDVIGIDDLIKGDFSKALEGVSGVIHVAAPLPGRMSAAESLDSAIEGSLNILRQAEKVGIRRFAFVSSIVAVNPLRGGGGWTDQGEFDIFVMMVTIFMLSTLDWSPVTREEALDGTKDNLYIYVAEKTLAERAVWDFAEKHPHIEVTTVNPPFFFGPFSPAYTNPDAKISALSTNSMVYELIRPEGAVPIHPSYIDVRDVALALVSALKSPPHSQVGRKRILMSGDWFSPKEAVEYIAEVRPELKDRVSTNALNSGPVGTRNIDNTRLKEVLGLVPRPWKETILDAVDSLIGLEKEWKSKGLVPI
ncbi:hypothetical protein NLI96_g9264 [Meripilus lineatus]|uniref:NAD-dependent epimerase/dehydratase domain-containing protein n=1 Tax=Meripilus lineatus TaxID=2056292 RepID=A0AAD5YFD7_9APHY|nr:hypothetical protein NLI96_g9264 [Physisporinus lineatus]